MLSRYCLIALLAFVANSAIPIPESFSTRRLQAEKITLAHSPHMAALVNDPKVQEALNTTSLEEFTNVSRSLEILTAQWTEYGYGLYTIFEKASAACIGFAGYHASAVTAEGTVDTLSAGGARNELELYIGLHSDYWRHGYGYEIMNSLIDIAAEHMPELSIIVYIQPKK